LAFVKLTVQLLKCPHVHLTYNCFFSAKVCKWKIADFKKERKGVPPVPLYLQLPVNCCQLNDDVQKKKAEVKQEG